MKSVIKSTIVRWSATLAIAGSAIIGSSTIGALQAFALPEQQIVQKLGPVLMYTITNDKGAPLVASVPNQKKQTGGVAPIFVNRQDAQAFIARLKAKNPQLAKNVRVAPLSLAEVYKLEQTNKNKPDSPKFEIVPGQQQVNAAMQLLRQSGQKVEQFKGTPLFVARAKKKNSYLTVTQANQQMVPFFFNKEELQTFLDNIKKKQPNVVSNLEIQVASLEGVLQALQTGNDQSLSHIILVPPQASVQEGAQLLRSRQPAGNQQRPQPAKR